MNKVRFKSLGSFLVLLLFFGSNVSGMKSMLNMKNTKIIQKSQQMQKKISIKNKQKTWNVKNVSGSKSLKQPQQLMTKLGSGVSGELNISKNDETNDENLISDVENIPGNSELLSQYETLQTSKWLESLLVMVKRDIKKFGNLKFVKEYFKSVIENRIELLVDKKNKVYETWESYFENVDVIFDNHNENKLIINFSGGKGTVRNAKFIACVYYNAPESCLLECISAS